jgi:hypothetical protein
MDATFGINTGLPAPIPTSLEHQSAHSTTQRIIKVVVNDDLSFHTIGRSFRLVILRDTHTHVFARPVLTSVATGTSFTLLNTRATDAMSDARSRGAPLIIPKSIKNGK